MSSPRVIWCEGKREAVDCESRVPQSVFNVRGVGEGGAGGLVGSSGGRLTRMRNSSHCLENGRRFSDSCRSSSSSSFIRSSTVNKISSYAQSRRSLCKSSFLNERSDPLCYVIRWRHARQSGCRANFALLTATYWCSGIKRPCALPSVARIPC